MTTSLVASTVLSAALLSAPLLSAQQDPELAAVLRAESARIETMSKVEPAVCSVMKAGAPGGGSGVVFDPLGFVLTNFHVVGDLDARRMRIGLPDGNLYDATVLGVDPGSDLAVLLLDPRADDQPWPFANLGDSDALLVGEAVFAMGNPFSLATDFKPTVTWGIVSGTHRYQPGQGNRALVYPDCIQVDAPVNPGNSGGPLFNDRGDVVGINGRISIRDRGRVNVGVGFAIASNQIRNFLGDLTAGRHAEHGTLDLNAWFRRALGNDKERSGVFVQSIFEDSKVKEFGLSLGDELLEFNGTTIRSANQLATLVGVLPTKTWVSLRFRPRTEQSYGEARDAIFQLTTLDTGSTNDKKRVASEEHRKIALQMILRSIADTDAAAEPTTSASLEIAGPDDRVVLLRRRGEQLRIDDTKTGHALIRTGAGVGFRIDETGKSHDLTLAEVTKLDRIATTNPWLRRGRGLADLLRAGTLHGGTMVGSRPAWEVALPGDGERRVYLFHDGTAAGCQYRDPVQTARIELRADGDHSQIVSDGQSIDGWTIAPKGFDDVPESLFEKPESQR